MHMRIHSATARAGPGGVSDNRYQTPRGRKSVTGYAVLFHFYPIKQSQKKNQKITREEVRTMSVLLSDLLLPGWAEGSDALIGLDAVTSVTGSGDEFSLPCHTADPELFFSEDVDQITSAKQLCRGCPMVTACLEGALSRSEPCGVWGGELFEGGLVIAAKRGVGRPRTRTLDGSSTCEPLGQELVQAS